jgi:hypothetical protein
MLRHTRARRSLSLKGHLDGPHAEGGKRLRSVGAWAGSTRLLRRQRHEEQGGMGADEVRPSW